MNTSSESLNAGSLGETPIAPTRKLKAAERRIFDRVTSSFLHLSPSDSEQLTQYAEAVARYEAAIKETKLRPLLSIPIINRSTGNVTGEKTVRNPAFATIKEATGLITSLARRLMIDAHSAEKRQKLLTKKARALAACESKSASDAEILGAINEEQIRAEMCNQAKTYIHASEDALRQNALWFLTVFQPSESWEQDEDIVVS